MIEDHLLNLRTHSAGNEELSLKVGRASPVLAPGFKWYLQAFDSSRTLLPIDVLQSTTLTNNFPLGPFSAGTQGSLGHSTVHGHKEDHGDTPLH